MADLKPLHKKIIEQVEFYFSDSNLPNDKFLQSEAAKDPEGYINIAIIASFKRMQVLTTDLQEVVNALKTSEFFIFDENFTKLKRRTSLPEVSTSKLRTVYVEGLPENSTLDSVKEHLNKYGEIKMVKFKKGKPSAFIEFATEKQTTDFIGQTVSIEEKPLVIVSLTNYINNQRDEKKNMKAQKRPKSETDDKSEQKEGDESKAKKVREERKIQRVDGVLVKFLGATNSMNVLSIKKSFSTYGKVAFVELHRDAVDGVIRFEEPAGAQAILAASPEGKITIEGAELKLSLVQGEEENSYWQKALSSIKRTTNKFNRSHKSYKFSKRRGGGRKRH
eukprot:TRINITY_DN55_c0_g4_i1.p1 TRINITY_DN55_c0_g4~~TRINITY_DN55_c0_g4_i1.p1  ORF type:complete len:334 (-),score=166.76 TRINITY_DN55_c0_g4_i1:246-1247(-)